MATRTDESITVLHVDDETSVCELTSEFLEHHENAISVETTTSPSEVIDQLEENPPDCIVSDYQMPRMDGITLLKRVRDRSERIPFILFTGKGSEVVASEAISEGVTDYLQKEMGTGHYEVLANRIKNVVVKSRVEVRAEQALQAIETAREGISILDEDGYFTYVNQAYADLYGYEQDEIVGESWEMLYLADDIEEIHETVLPAVYEEGSWQGETTGLRKDGATFTEDHAMAKTESDGLVCVVREGEWNDDDE